MERSSVRGRAVDEAREGAWFSEGRGRSQDFTLLVMGGLLGRRRAKDWGRRTDWGVRLSSERQRREAGALPAGSSRQEEAAAVEMETGPCVARAMWRQSSQDVGMDSPWKPRGGWLLGVGWSTRVRAGAFAV